MPELRRLRYALAVADDLNFTRAAARLGVSQQVLSAQVAQLEDELAVRIFDRSTREVRVTAAGGRLLDQARVVLDAEQALVDQARRLAEGQAGVVRLGYWRSAAFDTAPRLIAALAEAQPELEVEVHEVPTRALPAAVRDAVIDVGLSRWTTDTDGLFVHPIRRLASGVVLRDDDPLARHDDVDLADLAGRTIVIHPRSELPGRYDAVVAACAQAGFTPTLVGQRLPFDPQYSDVAAGRGVIIASAAVRTSLPPALVWRPLRGGALAERIELLSDPSRSSRARDTFIEAARGLAAADGWG